MMKAGVFKTVKGNWEVFDASRGLPRGVNKISQDKEGDLWIFLFTGISKFDGKNWTGRDLDRVLLEGHACYCGIVDSKGKAWFGSIGGIRTFRGEKREVIDMRNLGVGWSVLSIIEDRRGNLWFVSYLMSQNIL